MHSGPVGPVGSTGARTSAHPPFPSHRWHKPVRVYPPCDTRALQALPLDRRLKRLYLVSVAQFRCRLGLGWEA